VSATRKPQFTTGQFICGLRGHNPHGPPLRRTWGDRQKWMRSSRGRADPLKKPRSPLKKPQPGHPARVLVAWNVMPHRCVASFQAVTRSHAEKNSPKWLDGPESPCYHRVIIHNSGRKRGAFLAFSRWVGGSLLRGWRSEGRFLCSAVASHRSPYSQDW